MPFEPLPRKRPRTLSTHKRPRKLKSPQGLPTMHLHVRLVDAAYYFLEHEALRRGRSMASVLSDILLTLKMEQLRPHLDRGIHLLPESETAEAPDLKSGTTD